MTYRTGKRVPCKGKKKQSIEIVPERPEHIFKELKGTLSKKEEDIFKEENRDYQQICITKRELNTNFGNESIDTEISKIYFLLLLLTFTYFTYFFVWFVFSLVCLFLIIIFLSLCTQ